ncbi:hypothetical protein H9P43_004844 [Blastocladiella emersonii ATCC 22665]|nr:hypothetical protein H9P43_004832 [Blastocladiella emersonii ATCC 22665]KAI9179517.1 hypothetical protein H9P43_004844 [Blastocladiella emersonii ATCC 22665]
MEQPNELHSATSAGAVISGILGWSYFAAWSVSFYPQLVLNYRRKSVDGLSLDFLAYNVIGFTCYLIYTLGFYWSTAIQEEYRRRNDGRSNLVAPNDVFFAAHAWVLTIATAVQARQYAGNGHTLSRFAKVTIVAMLASTVVMLGWTVRDPGCSALDLVYFLGSWKLIMSLIKYLPQMWVNIRDQSTEGWSIHNILLDATGGTLSLAQLFLDAFLARGSGDDGSWLLGVLFGNAAKLGLSLLSLGFDAVFLVQHFVLYRGRPRKSLSVRGSPRRASDAEAGRAAAAMPSETDPLLPASIVSSS